MRGLNSLEILQTVLQNVCEAGRAEEGGGG